MPKYRGIFLPLAVGTGRSLFSCRRHRRVWSGEDPAASGGDNLIYKGVRRVLFGTVSLKVISH